MMKKVKIVNTTPSLTLLKVGDTCFLKHNIKGEHVGVLWNGTLCIMLKDNVRYLNNRRVI